MWHLLVYSHGSSRIQKILFLCGPLQQRYDQQRHQHLQSCSFWPFIGFDSIKFYVYLSAYFICKQLFPWTPREFKRLSLPKSSYRFPGPAVNKPWSTSFLQGCSKCPQSPFSSNVWKFFLGPAQICFFLQSLCFCPIELPASQVQQALEKLSYLKTVYSVFFSSRGNISIFKCLTWKKVQTPCHELHRFPVHSP